MEHLYSATAQEQVRHNLLKRLHPAMQATVKRIAEADLREELKPNTTRTLPVLALHWSHTENKNLCFGQITRASATKQTLQLTFFA